MIFDSIRDPTRAVSHPGDRTCGYGRPPVGIAELLPALQQRWDGSGGQGRRR